MKPRVSIGQEMKKLQAILLLVIAMLFYSPVAQGNAIEKDSIKTDTVKAQKIPLMKRVENFALKDNIVSKFIRTFIVFSNEKPANAPKDTTKKSGQPFKEFNKKPIRNIHVTVLNPFGYTVYDPVCNEISWLEKVGNRLHYPTRSWVIRNKLLFDKNEPLDAFQLSESERLLRQSAYINDAKIMVLPVDSSDSVDVNVFVQDVWGIGIGVTGDPSVPNGDIEFTDQSFLGLGQRFQSKLWYDEKYYNRIKYSGSFNIAEIGKTYISAMAYYHTENRDRNAGISFNRPFFSSITPWAGGLTVEFLKNYYNLLSTDSVLFSGRQNIYRQDVWAGYAFKSGPQQSLYRQKAQIVVAGRVSNINYAERNIFPEDVAQKFPNEITYLASTGYSFREYYKDRFIFGFGRTEDIPLGYQATYTAGIQQRDGIDRFYSGIRLSAAKTHSSLGYFFGSVETGGFIHKNNIEQGVFSTQLLFFTNLLPVNRWQIRQFLWNRFTYGYNRRPDEFININLNEGLRVFVADEVRGTKKWVSNYEIDFFTPYTPLGFRMVGVLSADLALIGTKEIPLTRSRLYQGYGIGVRLKNERLIFNTFELSLYYYPGAEDFGAKEFRYYHTEHSFYRFQGFDPGAPYILGF